jgi:aminoglycoside N3'-acetyltransferase
VNKLEAIELFATEGWTKADAERALKGVDFKTGDILMVIMSVARLRKVKIG